MMPLLTLVSLTLASVVSVASNRGNRDTIYYFPNQDDECIHTCDKNGYNYYWCWVVKGGSRECSLNPYTDYYGRECTDACRNDGLHGNYYYCNVEGGSWGYCSKWRKRPSVIHYIANYNVPRKNSRRDVCISSCQHFAGKSYSWCWTDYNTWDYCSITNEMDSYGQKCNKRCDVTPRTTSDFCYSSWFYWFYCGKVEDSTIVSHVTIKNVGTYPTISYQVTFTKDAREVPPPEKFVVEMQSSIRRVQRTIDNDPCCVDDTDRTFNTIFQEFDHQVTLNDSGISVEVPWDDTNSVSSSYLRQIPNGASRVEGIIAQIERRHIRMGPDERVDFPSRDFTYIRNVLGAQPGDERGHLVASSLGGPPARYNLVPQHLTVNRNVRNITGQWTNDWWAVENRMRQFFNPGEPGDGSGHIVWRVVNHYTNLTVGRPNVFQYIAMFYDENGEIINNLEWFPLAGICYNSNVPGLDPVQELPTTT